MTGKLGVVLWILESHNAESGRLGDALVQTVHFLVQHHSWGSQGVHPRSDGL